MVGKVGRAMRDWARKQIKGAKNGRRKKAASNPNTRKDANVERTTGDEPMAKGKSAEFNSRTRIRITHYRCRLCDPAGPSSKALLDGIVRNRILIDDSLLWIEEPIVEVQVKVKNQSEEETVIEIQEI